jgi:Alginate export
LTLQPSVEAGVAYFAQNNSWYGRSTANLGRNSDRWAEGYLKPGVGAELELGEAGRRDGRVSLVGAFTRGTDAAGTNVDDDTPTDAALDEAWLGWTSGSLFAENLGEDAVALSGGRQPFQLGSGFLIWEGSTNGGDRGAYWLAPRDAYEAAAVGALDTHGVLAQAFLLQPDDDPDTDTKLAGIDVGYALDEGGCALDAEVPNCVALGYYNVFESDIGTRDGMNVFDVRADVRPLLQLQGLRLAGEFAYERNGGDLEAYGWYGEVGYSADDLPWTPYLSYRYAFFSGDEEGSSGKSESFDPLFYDGPDWGTWTQGEILGEWVLANSNLVSHTVRLNAYPPMVEGLTLTALDYYFLLDDPGAAGVDDHDFSQEVNLIADYAVNPNFNVGLVGPVSFPEDAAEQFTGGSKTWSQLIAYATVSF